MALQSFETQIPKKTLFFLSAQGEAGARKNRDGVGDNRFTIVFKGFIHLV